MLKCIACLLMVVDHVNLLFPKVLVLRVFGRMAMPMFAFMIARGYNATKKHGTTKKYLSRLLVFAFLSQPPFVYATSNTHNLNIMFTWVIAVCILYLADPPESSTINHWSTICRGFLIGGFILFAIVSHVEYEVSGLLWVFGFYAWTKKLINIKQVVFVGILASIPLTVQYWGHIIGFGAIASVAAIPIIVTIRTIEDKRPQKPGRHNMFFYYFYPAHLLVLKLLQTAITK